MREHTETGAVFLTTDRVNNPVSALAGRTIVMGYSGWLFNFSVPYADRQLAVQSALSGRVDDPAVRRYAPDYLAVQSPEGEQWPVDRAALAKLPAVYASPEWTVYKVADAHKHATAAGR